MHSLQVTAMVRLFLALWLAITPTFVWAGSMTLLGAGGANGAAGGVSLSLDGTQQTAHSAGTSALALPAFSTTKTNDVIVVAIVTNGITVSSVTDTGGLTFAREPSLTPPNGGAAGEIDLWFAVSAGVLTSDVITIHNASSAFVTGLIFAVNGAHTAAPFDASSPATRTTSPYATLTTTSANTFGIGLSNTAAPSPGSGWTNMSAAAAVGFLNVNFQIFSSPQTANVFDTNVTPTGVSMTTAIIQGP